MTSREQVEQLEDEIGYRDFLIKTLQNKIKEQEDELKKIPDIESNLAKLRRKNKLLEDENSRLKQASENSSQKRKVVMFPSLETEKRLENLTKQLEDSRFAFMNVMAKNTQLKNENDLLKKRLIYTSPYGEIPMDVYRHIQSLEKKLKIAESGKKVQESAEKILEGHVPKKRGARQKISPEKVETMKRLREGGMSIRSIAENVEVSVGSVHRYLK